MRPSCYALTETKVDPETGEEYEHIVKEFQPQDCAR